MTSKNEILLSFAREVQQKSDMPSSVLSDLIRIGKSLHRIDEQSCNGYESEESEKRDELRERRLLEKAASLVKQYGFLVYHQSDPRGWTLYIYREQDLKGYPIDADYNRVAIGVPLI